MEAKAAAQQLDGKDELKELRSQFLFPKDENGKEVIYLNGNSLGLQPKQASEYVQRELDQWAKFAVRGHFTGEEAWLEKTQPLNRIMAKLVGAKESEVVLMNALSVNLHLMLNSFFEPKSDRARVLMEKNAFPSDQYAVQSHLKKWKLEEDLIIDTPTSTDEMLSILEERGEEIALVLVGSVNYLHGQAFDVKAITELAHKKGCVVGFDFAHGVGNLELQLHDHEVDFAVWCTYKYLNGGPGCVGGAFIHEKHFKKTQTAYHGWWGVEASRRFEMSSEFYPASGALSWQISNPPILQMAALKASLEIFEQVMERWGFSALVKKRDALTVYCEELLHSIEGVEVLTPEETSERGAQLSLKVQNAKDVVVNLERAGIYCDFRHPDVIRVAPTPLYNQFSDVLSFAQLLSRYV